MLAKITSKNQLTLPKSVTQAVGPAEYFDVQTRDGQIVLTPVRIQRGDAVRAKLAEGDVAQAARHLGRYFSVRGVVVVGDQRGRELGFPTANLPVAPEMATPADGVYAGWLRRLDDPSCPRLPAAISVGTNPTFNGIERRVESYVLDRTDLELYGIEIADFAPRGRYVDPPRWEVGVARVFLRPLENIPPAFRKPNLQAVKGAIDHLLQNPRNPLSTQIRPLNDQLWLYDSRDLRLFYVPHVTQDKDGHERRYIFLIWLSPGVPVYNPFA